MQINYKGYSVDLVYSASTKSYFGEIEVAGELIVLQATQRQHAMQIMHYVVDVYLHSRQELDVL